MFFIEFRRWDMNDKARYTYLCRKEQLYKSRMLKNILICMIKTKYNLENQNVGREQYIMIQSIYETHLHVRNLEKAIDFYQNKLGLTVAKNY